MATTGFWPVRGKLKDIIDYAENPDKTTEREYLDDDLYNALRYVENDDKTDRKMYVSAINCSKSMAYEQMTAVKRKYGQRGKVVAYHGYQSFEEGEVTPEEAHRIGVETARRMWGDRFQVVVTTHLNTANLHNHFVVNSVSFKDGKKYRNSIAQHRQIREISDELCREYGKSVLENSSFYGGKSRGAYWAERQGHPTHKEQIKKDVAYCIEYADSPKRFEALLKGMGYSFDQKRMSVMAPGWQRSVRLSSIGYPKERLNQILERNQNTPDFYFVIQEHRPYKPTKYPLLRVMNQLDFSISHTHDTATKMVDAILLIIIMTFYLLHEMKNAMLLSADMRHLERDLEQFVFDHRFMQKNNLHSLKQLNDYITDTQKQINDLEHERGLLRNKIRHEKSPEVKAENREQRQKITEHITPLRKDLKRAKRIMEESPHLCELIKQEHALEIQARAKNRDLSR